MEAATPARLSRCLTRQSNAWHRLKPRSRQLAGLPWSNRSSVERFLQDLRGTLQTNTDKARRLLARALDRIVLQCEGSSLVAHFYGNIAGVLQITDQETLTARAGAGRGI